MGSSGGACAGSFLFLDVSTDAAIDYICECAITARSHWRNALRIHDYCKGASLRFMTPNAGLLPLSRGMCCTSNCAHVSGLAASCRAGHPAYLLQ